MLRISKIKQHKINNDFTLTISYNRLNKTTKIFKKVVVISLQNNIISCQIKMSKRPNIIQAKVFKSEQTNT